jgi:exonuclease V gamma subunit
MYAFDASYFAEATPFRSYSEAAYRAANAFYSLKKQPPHRFFDRYAVFETKEMQEAAEWVDLKALAAFAKNPLKYYFNKMLGIYLSSDHKRMLKPEDEFTFAPWDKNRVKWEIAKGSPQKVIARTKKQGVLPFGLLKQLAVTQLNEEGANFKQMMEKSDVDPHALMDLHFTAHTTLPIQLAHRWEFPPLGIEIEEGKTIYLTGKVCDVSPQGLVVPIKKDLKSVAVYLPQLLYFLSAIKHYGLKALPQLIFAGDGAVLSYECFDVDAFLKKYLFYYFKARTTPSFLLPEWIKDILSHPDDLQRTIHKSLFDDQTLFFNDYALWCFQNGDDCPSGEEMMEHWKEEAQGLFEDLFRQVHARKSKSKDESL